MAVANLEDVGWLPRAPRRAHWSSCQPCAVAGDEIDQIVQLEDVGAAEASVNNSSRTRRNLVEVRQPGKGRSYLGSHRDRGRFVGISINRRQLLWSLHLIFLITKVSQRLRAASL